MNEVQSLEIYDRLHIGIDFCDPSKSWTCIFEYEVQGDPITEDAEFEVIDKKNLELPPANA